MFESAKMKLERADEHVRAFDRSFTDFINRRPHRPLFKGERKEGNVWRLWVEILVDEPLPPELSMILADSVHNFRCAMDHLAWELASFNGIQNRHTKFPVAKSKTDFESHLRGTKSFSEITKEFLLNVEAHSEGRGNILYGIHTFDNRDKHVVVTPILHASVLDSIVLIDLSNNERQEIDPIVSRSIDKPGAIAYEAPPGFGIDVDRVARPIPDVFFPDVEIFADQPVTAVLAWMYQRVEELIGEAEIFVTRNVSLSKGPDA